MLDHVDFSIDGYPVDSKRCTLIGKVLLKGKGKAVVVDNDEEDVEDIGGVGGTPSSSTINLEFDDSLNEAVPLGQANVSHSVSGDFAMPNYYLNVSDFDLLNILERPSLAPAGPDGSFAKKRRVASTNALSPLDRPSTDDDQLHRLEEKIKEQKHHQVEMERQLKAREDELKAL